jgi:hypothetical protein
LSASLYVYYKTAPDAEVARRVHGMQRELARRSGVQGRLMRRRDDACTWMEIYEGIGDLDAFEAMLAEAVARHRLEDLPRPGERRHAERFVDA